MAKLHKDLIEPKTFEPREGQREFLCSNKGSSRRPSLDLNEDDALNHLADVLVNTFLEEYNYVNAKQNTGNNLLPSLDKGTSR